MSLLEHPTAQALLADAEGVRTGDEKLTVELCSYDPASHS